MINGKENNHDHDWTAYCDGLGPDHHQIHHHDQRERKMIALQVVMDLDLITIKSIIMREMERK